MRFGQKLRNIFLILFLALALGCAKSPVTWQPDATKPPVLTMDPGLFGRGAIAIEATTTTLDIVVCQDGTSDWSLSRLFAWIGELAGSVFGGTPTTDGMKGPDPMAGCAALFGDAEPPPKPTTLEEAYLQGFREGVASE